MKRTIFFLLEKLQITPEERITITGLMTLLIILNLLNLWINPSSAAETEHYEAIRQTFEQRSAIVAKQEAGIMRRYNPGPQEDQPAPVYNTGALQDTLPEQADTTDADTNPIKDRGEGEESDKIDINTATLERLKTLPGVGPVYGERIIAYRDSTDGFNTVEELININGIGPKRLEDIRPHVEI